MEINENLKKNPENPKKSKKSKKWVGGRSEAPCIDIEMNVNTGEVVTRYLVGQIT